MCPRRAFRQTYYPTYVCLKDLNGPRRRGTEARGPMPHGERRPRDEDPRPLMHAWPMRAIHPVVSGTSSRSVRAKSSPTHSSGIAESFATAYVRQSPKLRAAGWWPLP